MVPVITLNTLIAQSYQKTSARSAYFTPLRFSLPYTRNNMTLCLNNGEHYFLAYDAESQLTSVSGTVSTCEHVSFRDG